MSQCCYFHRWSWIRSTWNADDMRTIQDEYCRVECSLPMFAYQFVYLSIFNFFIGVLQHMWRIPTGILVNKIKSTPLLYCTQSSLCVPKGGATSKYVLLWQRAYSNTTWNHIVCMFRSLPNILSVIHTQTHHAAVAPCYLDTRRVSLPWIFPTAPLPLSCRFVNLPRRGRRCEALRFPIRDLLEGVPTMWASLRSPMHLFHHEISCWSQNGRQRATLSSRTY